LGAIPVTRFMDRFIQMGETVMNRTSQYIR
jgi:hypothetical protein